WTRTTRYCTASWYPKSATSPTTTRRSQPSADCLNRGDSDVPSVCKIDKGWKQIWRGSAFAVDAPARRNCNKHISSHKVYYVKYCIARITDCLAGSGYAAPLTAVRYQLYRPSPSRPSRGSAYDHRCTADLRHARRFLSGCRKQRRYSQTGRRLLRSQSQLRTRPDHKAN